MEIFSKRLRELRKEKKLTQEDLADILHKTRSTMGGYEAEGKEPDFEFLCLIADFFDVSIDYLLGRTDIRKPTNGATILEEERIKSDYRKLPSEMKAIVTDTCDSFRSLLKEDISSQNKEHLSIYRNLFSELQSARESISTQAKSLDNTPESVTKLFLLEQNIKEQITKYLDQLLQLDLSSGQTKDSEKKSS